MATGKRVLPGAPAAAGFWTAPGRAMTAEHAIRVDEAVAAGPFWAARARARVPAALNAFPPRRVFRKPCTTTPE